MVIGFSMINVTPGAEHEMWRALAEVKNISKAVHVFGEFDYVVIIEANELAELNQAVDKIRLIRGVTTTRTFVEHELVFMK